MKINNNNLDINEAMNFAFDDSILLKRRNNNMLLSDYQVSVLEKNGIPYKNYSSIQSLLLEIERCLFEYYDDELDIVSSQISELIYYSETKK